MKKKTILFLIESLNGGGAEKVLDTLVRHIDKSVFSVVVCVISGGGKYEESVKNCVSYKAVLRRPNNGNVINYFFYVLKHHLVYKWLPLRMVYCLFLPQNCDIEIAFVEGFSTKLLSHSTNKKAKKFAWIHSDFIYNHWTESVYRDVKEEEHVYNSYNHLVAVSSSVRDALLHLFTLNPPVIVIKNPIDDVQIRNLSMRGASITYDHFRLVSVGRLESIKAFDRLIRIVSHLVEDGFPIELWILGEGSDRDKLEKLIALLHLESIVTLWGFQPNPYQFMSKCNLYVCSSVSEGYSTSVTESLILGIPVVTTNCSGMKDLLNDGECGIITENSEDSLLEGVKRVLSDEELYTFYKRNAELRSHDFSIDVLMKPIERFFLS